MSGDEDAGPRTARWRWPEADDLYLNFVGIGIPMLLAFICWFTSTALCTMFLTELLQSAVRIPPTPAMLTSLGVTAAFVVASWARLTIPGRIRDAGNFASALILGAWVVGAASHFHWDNIDTIAGPWTAVSSGFMSNVALVKMFDSLRAPGVTAHSLYRFFDAGGKLLYIGITSNPRLRFAQHRKAKVWWSDIATREIVHYKSRVDLMNAERDAIKRERPLYNIQHAGNHR